MNSKSKKKGGEKKRKKNCLYFMDKLHVVGTDSSKVRAILACCQ
jgi:hypothetical protein